MSFNVISLTRIATMTIRLLFNVAVLNAIFFCTIFTRLLVSTLVYFVIVFLTFEALLNTTHRLVVFHYFRRILVQYIMIYQFIRHVDVRQFQHHRRKILFMTFFRNSSYIFYLQARVKCSVHSLQRFNCLLLSFLVLIEYAFDAYVMYNDDVHLTLQIRLFTDFFRSFFVALQCFTRLLIVDLEHDDFFKVTSCCQYVLS